MQQKQPDYLDRQARYESNARMYPRTIPVTISEASGAYVTDTEGRTYLDCLAGAGTLALGHNHPVAIGAMRKLLDAGSPLHALDLSTPAKDRFAETLLESIPEELAGRAKIQFCGAAGADAVEASVKLAKTATGNTQMLSFSGGFHGMTHGALSLSGNLGPKEPVGALMPEVQFLPSPSEYRCPFGIGGEEGHRAGSRYIEHLLDDPEGGVKSPAAMIVEAVQGEGGANPAPDEWLAEIRRITAEREIPLILDEVQAGVGRTGAMYAFEHAGITPDAVVLSKAIGGSLPLAVVVYDERLDEWKPGAHSGTFRGNQLAMAAGEATIRHILDERLYEHAEKMGERLMAGLREVQRTTSCIGEVRGRGLLAGAEVVDPGADPDRLGSRPESPELASRIQAECLKRGLIQETGGRYGAVLRFLPPLIVTGEEVNRICEIFGESVAAAERHSERDTRNLPEAG